MYINTNLYLNLLQCPKLFVSNLPMQKKPFIDPGLRHYIHEYVNRDLNIREETIEDSFKATIDAMKNHQNIGDALFLYKQAYVIVDALKYTEDGYIAYFVRGATKNKKEYKQAIGYAYYIFKKLGIHIKSIYICTINPQYVRYGKVDPRLLFTFHDVTQDTIDMYDQTKKNIHTAFSLLDVEDMNIELSTNCLKGLGCSKLCECFKDIPIPSIFDVCELPKDKMLEYYNQGIITFEDMLERKLPLTQLQAQQIESYVNNLPPHINHRRLTYFMNQFKYPLYFLDFETFQVPVPLYDGSKPYESIPFQYSLHVLEEDGTCRHYEFLGDENTDPREALAKSLCENISSDATIIAYNNTLEKSVIMSLAIRFEDYRERLLDIYPHIHDLQYPFEKGDYYHKDMLGKHSLKVVLPALCPDDPSLDYHNLDGVHNGNEAMFTYTRLNKLSDEDRELARKNLLKYCELDTLAMVKIYQKVIEDLKSSEA